MGTVEFPLVVGVDGSTASYAALDWAVDCAARHGLRLHLVYGSLWERYEGAVPSGLARPSGQVMAENVVAVAAERAGRRSPEAKITTEVVPEDPVHALLERGRDAFAVVTGSRGRGEIQGLLLGSVGLAVAARATCPVVVVRGDQAGLAGSHQRILLGVGDAEAGDEAVRFAFREAEARDCALDAVRAWRRPAGQDAGGTAGPTDTEEERAAAALDAALREAEAAHAAVKVRRSTLEGPARSVLLHRSAAADLAVIGARRRREPFGLQLSRVAHTLLHHADCPVAVVPHVE
ncbi:universal stress protein [Streptomyces sp. NPDC127100]|uniref:universal stress protein n=1 Tax=Streptomyces sp. NPDC127100 TaxID=3347138 RepID=UPI003651D937